MCPLVQEARVTTPCSSSEKSSTSSSGTKRRGRGSFLYDKSVLYSDQCGSERDLDDKGSDPARGGSKGHADEKDNKDGNLFRMTSLLCLVSLLMVSKLNSCSFVWFCSCKTIWDKARPCSLRLPT